MRLIGTRGATEFFHVTAETPRSQAATMVLQPGQSSGDPNSTHPGDQWLYVVAGSGRATVAGREMKLEPGSLLLVEAGERHQIVNLADVPLETINIYSPPAY
jgi:mannose-6-phosphate isomerase-like protein (cupin superfamily)